MFSKMGQHKQALEIYVFKLEDYAKAEEYVIQLMIMDGRLTTTDTVTTSTRRIRPQKKLHPREKKTKQQMNTRLSI